jgi:hypothetical protein
MKVSGENDVRFEALNSFVRESAGRENNREVTDEDARKSRLVLHFMSIFIGKHRHFMDDAIDVINVELVFKLPLTSVLEIVVESFHLRRLHHFRAFASDIIVAGQVNRLNVLDLRENVGESREISVVFDVIGEGRLVWK